MASTTVKRKVKRGRSRLLAKHYDVMTELASGREPQLWVTPMFRWGRDRPPICEHAHTMHYVGSTTSEAEAEAG
jgi:hypothetical protein